MSLVTKRLNRTAALLGYDACVHPGTAPCHLQRTRSTALAKRKRKPAPWPVSGVDDSYGTLQRDRHRRVGRGVTSLSQLVRELPLALGAAVAIALHVAPESPSVLPKILTRERTLEAIHPEDGEPLRHGQIYVAPPGRHLLVNGASFAW